MPTIPGRARRWLVVLLAGWLCLPFLVTAARAQEAPGLVPGATAVLGNADGGPVPLRDAPADDGAVLGTFPEGTAVDIGGGPIVAPDGSRWYVVGFAGQTGYMVADFLIPAVAPAPASAVATAPAAAEPTAVAPTPLPTESAATTPPAALEPTVTPSPAAAVPEAAGETAVATDAVNLRAEPRADAPILLVVPAGAAVSRTGDVVDGFAPVSYQGTTGWTAIAFLTLGATAPDPTATTQPTPVPATPTVTAEPDAEDGAEAGTEAEASATDLLNLRAGPSYDDAILRVMPPGAPLTVTGPATAGFLPVLYNGTPGWVDAAFLETGAVATPEPPSDLPPPTSDPVPGTATTTDTVNLRTGPSEADPVAVVVPAGAVLETTGTPRDGFYPVAFADRTGWVADAFLRFEGDAPPAPDDATPIATEEAAASAATPDADEEDEETDATSDGAAGFSGIAWPVAGGTWEILQGYNGSSHQNQDGLWQYYYSLDLVRADGETAGQTVVSPVNGTVRWTDPSTGGMSIDIGGGHAVAFFHVAVDPSLEAGDPLAQGQPVGTISGPGGPGFAGTPHLHFTLWETTDGGNWSRAAAPFVGRYAIAGQVFPDIGGGNQHRGTTFTP